MAVHVRPKHAEHSDINIVNVKMRLTAIFLLRLHNNNQTTGCSYLKLHNLNLYLPDVVLLVHRYELSARLLIHANSYDESTFGFCHVR